MWINLVNIVALTITFQTYRWSWIPFFLNESDLITIEWGPFVAEMDC
jgi:hypothetical protein